MYTAKHILQVKRIAANATDELGRPIKSDGRWVNICKCRCDDNTTKYFKTDNGSVYRPAYHIVCDGQIEVMEGSIIRCIDENGRIRGEGKVYTAQRLNFLPYTEVWV